MTYFNTTRETGRVLKNNTHKADSQEGKILNIFRKSKNGLTASQIHSKYFDENIPLTSIRRAISNLLKDGFLEKTDLKKTGIYGRNEYVYQLFTGQLKFF